MIDLGSELKPNPLKIYFKGQTLTLYLQKDGVTYKDAQGTEYPEIDTDYGYCGVSPFETGKGDPWWKLACEPHDMAFDKARAGYADSTQDNLATFGKFSQAIGTGMLTGAYQVISGPFYWLLGGVYGFFREQSESK